MIENPIFKKTYELIKLLFDTQRLVPRHCQYTLWQRCQNTALGILEDIIYTGQNPKDDRAAILRKLSVKIDLLRVFIRLAYESRAIDPKKHAALQSIVDEIGRMLGGWLKIAGGGSA